ncbi:MAG: SpoIIE family protein phosphatase [Cytophagaceae bacterium]|jgi:sigma-B regulation protein RsbU (phosphoserine phosphatase)|nr:SpoIIE family protein phosphatase [Cytophagaceae bacterium]
MITQLNKKRLRTYKDRLNILLDLAQTINEDHGIDDLLSEFEILLREELEVGKIVVITFSNDKWTNLLTSGVSPEEISKIDVERDLLKFTQLESITVDPPENLKGFDAIIPLSHRYRIIGYVLIGDVDEEHTGISPTIKHLKLIQIISNIIIVFIENMLMHQAILEQEAIKKELELASKIQSQLIPSKENLPQHSGIVVHTIYQPHLGVGGDYYDFIQLSRNTFGFCVADVSGKGIAAALLMSNFQAIIRSLFTANISLKKLVNILNDKVNQSANSEKFITMFIGKYNTLTQKLSYVNAGHLPPLLYDPAKQNLTPLEKGCIGLGMLDAIPTLDEGCVRISKNSKLIAFTDGLVEIEKDDQVTSGMASLEEIISNTHSIEENIREIQFFIDNNISSKNIFDDISLVGIGFR